MKLVNRIWVGGLFVVGVVGLSALHEFQKVKQSSSEYLARWDDEIAKTYLQKKDPSLLEKILREMEKERILVVETPLAREVTPVLSRAIATFSYPLTYYGLPVGQMTFGISVLELLKRALVSAELFFLLLAGLLILTVGSKMTLRDYRRTLHHIVDRIEGWAERGISFEEQSGAMNPTEKRIGQWIEKGTSLEIARRQLEKDLEHEKKWNDLSRQVVHDLRAPLSVFEDYGRHPSTDRNPALLQMASRRMRGILHDLHRSSLTGMRRLLSVSRLHEILHETVQMNQRNLPAQGLEVLSQITPAQMDELIISEDDGLARILQNLVANAIEAHPSSHEVMVRIEIFLQPAHLVLRIKDGGQGMSPGFLEKVGTRGVTSKATGTGLGLHGAKTFMIGWGGSLAIQSLVNLGTEVTLTFLRAE